MKYATAFSFLVLFGLAEVALAEERPTYDQMGNVTGYEYVNDTPAPKAPIVPVRTAPTTQSNPQINNTPSPVQIRRATQPKRPTAVRAQQRPTQSAPATTVDPAAECCGEKNKNVVADVVDARDQCSKVNGSFQSYDSDESSACFCLGEGGTSRKIDPLKGESCARSATGNTQLDQCLQKWETKAKECADSAERAVKSCDQDKSADKGMKYVKDFTKNYSNQSITANVGKGAASQCAQASLIGNTAINGMNSFKTTCDENFITCNKACEEVNRAYNSTVIADECMQFATTVDEKIKSANTIAATISASEKGTEACTVEAKKEKEILEQTLESIGRSVQAGKMCECQLAGAGADCNLVPNPTECLPGGRLFGQSVCNVFSSCALGSSDYSSIPCQCARDSSASICRTPAGKPAPSNFAVDLKPGTNGGVDVGGPGGGVDDGGGMNLGGNYNINKPASEYKDPAETAKSGKPAGGANPASGGGARGASGGDDPNALAGAEEDGSGKGLAGLFNQAKSSLSNMLGGGNRVTGKGLLPNGAGQGLRYDINKWRPRGLASMGCQGNQVRCKNEDIFTIVNRRYDVNETTFLNGP